MPPHGSLLEMRIHNAERNISALEDQSKTLQESVYGSQDTIGVRARVLEAEKEILEIRGAVKEIVASVKRIERIIAIGTGVFATIKFLFELAHK